ncbi:MAG TPA: ThuA domain-containing protein [Opitutaceae bacterium]|nr:ThuA domain-containing protein [Opitutaceae bacterium]
MITICSLLLAVAVAAADGRPAAPAPDASATIRTLVFTGGHGFHQPSFLGMFASNPQLTFQHVEHTKGTADGWERADLAAFDVIVLYDMPRSFSPAQQARFRSVFPRGTGLVVLHHALVGEHQWREYETIIGGIYPVGSDPGAAAVGYRHDLDIPVRIVDRTHPITAGLPDFIVHDEIYWGYRVGGDVTPLLRTTHPDSGNPLAWCREEGKSRIVYLQLGHGPACMNDPNYRELLARSIRWVARR